MSRYQKEISQCVIDNKILKLKIQHLEETVLEYMVKINVLEKKFDDNTKLIDKIYILLSHEISELNESVTNISPLVSSNSDDK